MPQEPVRPAVAGGPKAPKTPNGSTEEMMIALALIAQLSAPGGSGLSLLLLYGLLGVVLYVFLIHPARKRQKEHQAMLAAITAGDRVVTSGGIVGTVVKIDKDSLRLKLAPSVEVTLVRSYVVGKAPEEVS